MLDMAVGIVIGFAFGTVIKSLVDDLLMPLIASIFGTADFTNLFVMLKEPADMAGVNMDSIAAVREAGGIALGWGLFINALIAFILVALALYVAVRNMKDLGQAGLGAPLARAARLSIRTAERLQEVRSDVRVGELHRAPTLWISGKICRRFGRLRQRVQHRFRHQTAGIVPPFLSSWKTKSERHHQGARAKEPD